MVGITMVSPHAVDESAPCLQVRNAASTSQMGCRICKAHGFSLDGGFDLPSFDLPMPCMCSTICEDVACHQPCDRLLQEGGDTRCTIRNL